MKKFIAIIMCIGLLVSVSLGEIPDTKTDKPITVKLSKEDIEMLFKVASLEVGSYSQDAHRDKEIKIITDAMLSRLYTCKDDERYESGIIVNISYDDAQLLMKVAVLEDYTDAISQANIMLVILNRVASPLFPNSVREVLYQINPVQFATVYSKKFEEAEPDVNSHLALAMIESGEITSDALYFEAKSSKNTWMKRKLEYLFSSGATDFYK